MISKDVHLDAVAEGLLEPEILILGNGEGQLLERLFHLRLKDVLGLLHDQLNVLGRARLKNNACHHNKFRLEQLLVVIIITKPAVVAERFRACDQIQGDCHLKTRSNP